MILLLARGSRPFGLFLFYFFYTPLFSSLSFNGALGFPWLCIFLFGSFFSGLLWAFVGYSLDLRGFVLFVSYLSHRYDFGFHFLFFCRGAQGC